MWFPLCVCNVRVGHLSQVRNPRLDFRFSLGLGEDGAVATIGSNAEASKAIGKESMLDMNGLPVTDEICHWHFYQLSISIIMCVTNIPIFIISHI